MEKEIKISEEKIKEILEEKLPKWFEEKLSSDYSNPLKEAVEEEIKEQDGVIKKFIREIFSNVLEDPKFKEEIGKEVIGKIVSRGLNN